MHRALFMLASLALVACGGAAQSMNQQGGSATATRGAELAQIATLTAPTSARSGAMVVTVQQVPGWLNVRLSADMNAEVIAKLGEGTDIIVIEPVVTGADGSTKWVHVQVGDRDGYVRTEFVSQPHAASGPIATPIFLATRVPTGQAASANPTPTSAPSPTPSTRSAAAPLAKDAIATIQGAYSVTITQLAAQSYPATEPITKVSVALRIQNLSSADLRYTPCSFILRDGNGEDNDAIACNDPAVSQGAAIVGGGGSRVDTAQFAYYTSRKVLFVRFAPVTPAGTTMYFG